MKLYLFYSTLIFALLGLTISLLSTSLTASENIDDDLKKITSKLRCMTCQNQTIYSSDTDFSKIIKKIVKDKLEKKESEKDIIDFITYRYGEYILFKPKMSKQNIFLWVFPFLILAISLTFFIFRINKNS